MTQEDVDKVIIAGMARRLGYDDIGYRGTWDLIVSDKFGRRTLHIDVIPDQHEYTK